MRNRAYFRFRTALSESGQVMDRLQALVGDFAPAGVFPDSAEFSPPPSRGQPASEESAAEPIQIRHRRIYHFFKRLLDITASVVALAIFAILLPFIALAIRLDSPGPIFFIQERVGMNRRWGRPAGFQDQDRRKVLQPGRPFRIFKLRTMRIDAEANGPQWATRSDSRVTRVGRFLRHTRLDEVPQFINVLRGDMSLIGPRPERLCFIRQLEKEVPYYRDRLLVLPGITGLAQVRNGYDQDARSVCRKVELDRLYIKQSNPLFDLKILISTIKVVITGDGAH